MTQPPQPGQPYGQQPDPYGQGGQPQSGGFPQQYPGQQHPGQQYPGQQYPGQQYPQQGGYDQTGAYGQQPYSGYEQQQYPPAYQYGQGFGGPPAPPAKNKTGLLIAIAAAVVVLVAVGVTGFVAPGFFLSKDKTTAGPQQVAQQIVDAINAKDQAALKALKCADAEPDVDQVINGVSAASNATLGQVQKVSESEYRATVTLKVNGRSNTATGTITSAGEKWCWKLVSGLKSSSTTTPRPPTTSSSSSPSQPPVASSGPGPALIQSFVDKINAKDKAGATALVCPGSENLTSQYINEGVSGTPQITATVSGTGDFISADVGGTFNGKKANGIVTAQNTTGTFCVSGFVVY